MPTYGLTACNGHPAITNLTGVTAGFAVTKTSGEVPCTIFVEAWPSNLATSDSGAAFTTPNKRAPDAVLDLAYTWNFGESGVNTITDPVTGATKDLGTDQCGPVAAYRYTTPGTYTITLTAKGNSGAAVTTSTSTTCNAPHVFEIFTGYATGGSCTVTINGNTSAAINYNDSWASILAKLQAITGVGAARVQWMKTGWAYRLQGSFLGTAPTVTLASSFTGNTGTPAIRVIRQGGTAAGVTVGAWSGTTQHFDPTAAGGGTGSIGSPYSTEADLAAWVATNPHDHARLLFKAGTTTNVAATIMFIGSTTRMRWGVYGAGARPVLNVTGANTRLITWQEIQGGDCYDVDFDGLELRNSTTNFETLLVYKSGNGDTTKPYPLMNDFVFNNCLFTDFLNISTWDRPPNDGSQGGRLVSSGHGWYWQGCEFTGANAVDVLAYIGVAHLVGTNACYSHGGGTAAILSHYLYTTCPGWHFHRWHRSGPVSQRNFNFNTRCERDSTSSLYQNDFFLIDSCDLAYTINGVNAGPESGQWTDGAWNRGLVQNCAGHTAGGNSQGFAGYFTGVNSLVIRGCNTWEQPLSDFRLFMGNTCTVLIYGNKVYRDTNSNGAGFLEFLGNLGGRAFGNTVWTADTGANSAGIYTTTSNGLGAWPGTWPSLTNFKFDGNTYYHPNNAAPFVHQNTPEGLVAWKAYGFDADAADPSQPNWSNPAAGNFGPPQYILIRVG